MTDKTRQDSGSTHIIRYALELGLLWIDGSGRDNVREALDALDTLEAQLEAIGAGGVSGPLIGRASLQSPGFDAADMATASAQGFRDGVASLSANAGEPTEDVKQKIASNTWDHFGDILPTLKAISRGEWYWGANSRCKYIEIRLDTRDGGCLLYDRERVRISPEQFAHQHHRVRMEPWPASNSLAAPPTAQAEGWVSVDERLPEHEQAVAFVVRTDGFQQHLNGCVLGGCFVRGQGFFVPGLGLEASHWMPLPPPPTSAEGVEHG